MNREDILQSILSWRPNGERFIDFRGAPCASSGISRFFKTPSVGGTLALAFLEVAGTILETIARTPSIQKPEVRLLEFVISQAIVPVAHYTFWKLFDRKAPAKDMVIDMSGLATPDISRLATRKMRKYFLNAFPYGFGAGLACFAYPDWVGAFKNLGTLSPVETVAMDVAFNLTFNAFSNAGWCAFASFQLKNRRWNVVERPGSSRVNIPSTNMLPKTSAP